MLILKTRLFYIHQKRTDTVSYGIRNVTYVIEEMYVRNNSYSEHIFGTENLCIYARDIQLRYLACLEYKIVAEHLVCSEDVCLEHPSPPLSDENLTGKLFLLAG